MFSLTSHLIGDTEYLMADEFFSDPLYDDQTHLAESELSSFISAVTELYVFEQASLSAKDWLDEADLMDTAPFSTERDWRAVTIAASARLAYRLSSASTNTNSVTAN